MNNEDDIDVVKTKYIRYIHYQVEYDYSLPIYSFNTMPNKRINILLTLTKYSQSELKFIDDLVMSYDIDNIILAREIAYNKENKK